MPCMDHYCRACGHSWFDNARVTKCPECGSEDVTNLHDEWRESYEMV